MDEHRAADLQWALTEPGIDMVHMLGGGYGAARLYPRIDWDALGDPRIVCGFSDITAIHLALAKHGPWTTFYGPNFSRFTRRKDELTDETKEWFHRAFKPEPLGRVFEDPENPYVLTIGGGNAEAPIVGGCMTLVCHSIGTPYEIDTDGCILMIEDLNEEPYMVDAGLHHLIRAGKFEGVKGFVFGTDVNLKENTIPEYVGSSLSIEEILDELIAPLGIPAIANVPVGHGKHMATIPLGRAGAARRRRQDARDRRARACRERGDRPRLRRPPRARPRLPAHPVGVGLRRRPALDRRRGLRADRGGRRQRRDRRAGREAPDGDRRHRRPRPDRAALRHVRRAAARRGLDARPVRGRDRRRPHLRARRRQLEGRARGQPARVRRRRQPVPPGAADGRGGGARQPAARPFCAEHRDELRADWALDFDMHEGEDGTAPVVAGCKGLHELELRAGDGVDVHSSLIGSVPVPASDLMRALIALQDAIPAANVTWMIAGTPEDTSRTVVPGSARAGIDLRFDSDGDALLERVRELIPPGVELIVKGVYPAATSPLDAPPVQAMARVMERLGTKPAVAAQAPWWGPYFLYGAPFASGGLGRSAGAHGPDEWCEVDGLRRFMHMAYDTVEELAPT